jgi:hypothetical protein
VLCKPGSIESRLYEFSFHSLQLIRKKHGTVES